MFGNKFESEFRFFTHQIVHQSFCFFGVFIVNSVVHVGHDCGGRSLRSLLVSSNTLEKNKKKRLWSEDHLFFGVFFVSVVARVGHAR